MKIVDAKNENIYFPIPINVRGKEVTNYEYHDLLLDDLKHYQITTLPFFHQIPHELKVTKTIELLEQTQDLKNIDDLFYLMESSSFFNEIHPELKFSFESILLNKFILQKPTYLSCKINELYGVKNHYYNVLKIKITPSTDPLILLKFEDHLKLRLDGNRLFSKEQLKEFIRKIPEDILSRIEYIEEPCTNYLDSIDVLTEYKIKIACDESLTEVFIPNHLNNMQLIDFAILKPSLIGLTNSINLINHLNQINIQTIISSSYELNTGFNALIYLSDYANRVCEKELFHGLDTIKFFPAELFDAKLKEDQISLFY